MLVRFSVLDSWRGVAALAVALFHFTAAWHLFDNPVIRNGKFFVDFFFVLSGFVIAHAYHNLAGRNEVEQFLLKRFARIAPMHYFTLSIFFGIEIIKLILINVLSIKAGDAAFTGPNSVSALAGNFLFLQGMNVFSDWTWNIPSWSISVEFYTYIVFAAVLVAAKHNRNILLLLIWLTSGFYLFWSVIDFYYTDPRLAFTRCVFEFFSGVITYRIYAWTNRNIVVGYLEMPLLVLSGVLFSILGKKQLIFVAPFIFSSIVYVFAHEQGRFSNFLQNNIFQALGKLSFSIYMVHFIVLTILNSGTRVLEQLLKTPLRSSVVYRGERFDLLTAGGPWLLDLSAILYIVLILATSILTFRYIEMPGQIYFRKVASRYLNHKSTAAL